MIAAIPASDDATQISLEQAICEWRGAIGAGQVTTDTARYNCDTSNFGGRIPVVLRPVCTEQVQHVLKNCAAFFYPDISDQHRTQLGIWHFRSSSITQCHPRSVLDEQNPRVRSGAGRGYPRAGSYTGRTQRIFASHSMPFLVPVTGAGPSCSVVANALERGFGVTPITDHFGAIISMKVVLPDGEIYESYTRSFNGAGSALDINMGQGRNDPRAHHLAAPFINWLELVGHGVLSVTN
jgi:4-cresol dehydrogenase (hydroxylating)